MTKWGDRHDIIVSVASMAIAMLITLVIAFVAWTLVTVATEGVQAVMP